MQFCISYFKVPYAYTTTNRPKSRTRVLFWLFIFIKHSIIVCLILKDYTRIMKPLEEPKRERFCKQPAFYSKVLAETDELL